jgi:glycosyltransferase involved in cell wall biosynthesis
MQIKAIHQFSPSCSVGDGVTNGMLFTRRLLRELGFESEIYCDYVPPSMAAQALPLRELRSRPQHLLLAHHCLGYENCAWLNELSMRKVMVYHNITPPHLLPEDGGARRLSVLGRQQLEQWPSDYLGAIGDSEYNSIELREAGYRNIATIPLLVDIDRVRHAPWDRQAMLPYRDSINLLFVGRICENKQQLALLDTLYEFLHYTNQPVKLILAGGVTSDIYRQLIVARIEALDLQNHVVMAGKVSDEGLLALYRCADAFVCLSEHEGFGMPLIEAMLFDVPVVAHAISSVPDTLGEGGLLLDSDDPAKVAALLNMLMTEPALRRQVIAGQRRNLARFAPAHLRRQLADYLGAIGVAMPNAPSTPKAIVPTPSKPYWQVEGPFDSNYSLAIVNRECAKALAQRGADVGLRSMEGAGDYPADANFLQHDPLAKALAHRCTESATLPDVALRFCYPPHVDDMQAVTRVVHSYGWEETGFPQEYVRAFNRKLDLVTVLSRFVARVLRDNGVRIPIAVTGAGVDHLLKVTPQAPALELRKFCFLHISSCFPRKGVDVLLAAFGQAFRQQDDVSLVIKTFPNPHNNVAQQLATLRQNDPTFPHVVLIEEPWSDAELVGWYHNADAFVAPSRGEGLGLPLAEAMLFDVPVITTDWSGQRDFCTDATAWLCEYQFAPAKTHLDLDYSVWAEPDADHLARLLREVHDSTPEARQPRIDAARQHVLTHLTWDRVAQATEQAVQALAREVMPRREPAIGWITTWHTRCGIAAYSSFLTTALTSDRLTILANRTEERVAPDHGNVVRCWNSGLINSNEEMNDVFDQIIERKLNVIVIQYNYSFYTLPSLAGLIDRLAAAKVSVHCFFHSTADQLHFDRLISLSSIVASLRLCERLYVHGLNDLNNLKRFGLVDNVTLFPQGVLPTPQSDGNAERAALGLKGKKIIAAYGFLLPNKGIQKLIAAFALLAKKDLSLHLLLVTALYPAAESTQLLDECNLLIQQNNLSQRVTFETAYLSDDESLAKLRTASLIVYPYERTEESSSAAVRMGLASGRPVAVTPLPIFDDVADAVHRLPGVDIDSIANGIQTLLSDPLQLSSTLQNAERWRAPRQWDLLSNRLLNLIDGIANPLSIDA